MKGIKKIFAGVATAATLIFGGSIAADDCGLLKHAFDAFDHEIAELESTHALTPLLTQHIKKDIEEAKKEAKELMKSANPADKKEAKEMMEHVNLATKYLTGKDVDHLLPELKAITGELHSIFGSHECH